MAPRNKTTIPTNIVKLNKSLDIISHLSETAKVYKESIERIEKSLHRLQSASEEFENDKQRINASRALLNRIENIN